jgi:hypothetical protein
MDPVTGGMVSTWDFNLDMRGSLLDQQLPLSISSPKRIDSARPN